MPAKWGQTLTSLRRVAIFALDAVAGNREMLLIPLLATAVCC